MVVCGNLRVRDTCQVPAFRRTEDLIVPLGVLINDFCLRAGVDFRRIGVIVLLRFELERLTSLRLEVLGIRRADCDLARLRRIMLGK